MTEPRYHFIGVGGIGMSALARILLQKGVSVQGSDQASSPLLEELCREGAEITVGHNASTIKEGTTVVYSSDIKETNEELIRAKELSLAVIHRSDLLDYLMRMQKPLLVTGTHGKTTTSALLASVLCEADLDPSFAVGGILRASGMNGRAGKGPFFVAEADESDGSFLKTPAFGAIVTNLNNDHLKFWETEESLNEAFRQFFSQTLGMEHLFWCCDDQRLGFLKPPGISYGFSPDALLRIEAFEQTDRGIVFDLNFQGKKYSKIELSLFGRHNALNGAAVFGLSCTLQIPEEKIRSAFQKFSGTKRRLEYKGEAHKVQLFDDYGHHPVEIAATLRALRDHIKEKRLVVIFQPHRYTRVSELFDAFLSCFDDADEVILTDIYSAGEVPIPGITTALLYTKLKEALGSKLHFFPRAHLEAGALDCLKPLDVVLTIGAGDVTRVGEPLLAKWKEKGKKMKVALLCGGTSAEHEVSLISAREVLKGLDASVYEVALFGITKEGDWITGSDTIERLQKHTPFEKGKGKIPSTVLEALVQCEVALPVFHGPEGEDGMIQGFLDTLQIPYGGCDYRAGALCMDKVLTKQIAIMNNIPTAPFLSMDFDTFRQDPKAFVQKIQEQFQLPIWIKPVHLGSSIGVSRVNTVQEILEKARYAFSYDDLIIVEEHIEGKQIEFGIVGNKSPRVGPPCEILNQGAFVDYAGKYGEDAMPYAIPANISELETAVGIDLAKRAYLALQCQGLARVDFFLDEQGYYWLNEINPFPGCTGTSAFPKIWQAINVSLGQISDTIIASALQRTRALERSRGK